MTKNLRQSRFINANRISTSTPKMPDTETTGGEERTSETSPFDGFKTREIGNDEAATGNQIKLMESNIL